MAKLLAAFDVVGGRHAGMAAALFNDDGTYKAGINLVRVGDVTQEGCAIFCRDVTHERRAQSAAGT